MQKFLTATKNLVGENISDFFPDLFGQKLASVSFDEVIAILENFSHPVATFRSEIAILTILPFSTQNCSKTPDFILHENLNEMSYETLEDGVGKLSRQIFQKFYFCCRQKFLR